MKKELRYPLFFAAITLLYFYSGLSGRLLACSDGITEFFPLMTDINNTLKQGTMPLWNHHMFAGFPQMASMQPAVLYPPHRLLMLLPPVMAFNINILVHIFFAGYFMFLYARLLCRRDFPALMAGAAFAFMGFMQYYSAITPMLDSAAWLPLILYFVERLRLTLRIEYALSAAIAMALQFYAGHPQTVFQSQMLVSFYIVYFTFASDKKAFLGMGVLSILIGFLLSLPQIVAVQELSTLSLRQTLSYEKFSQFSFPLHMLPTMLLPDLWQYKDMYFGPASLINYPEGFMGILTLVVGVLAGIKMWRSGPHTRFWMAACAIALVLSLGGYLPFVHRILFHVPGFNVFRAPVRHMLEMNFALSVLFAFGLARIVEGDRKFIMTTLKTLIGVAAGVVVSVFILRGVFRSLSLVSPEFFLNAVRLGSPSVYIPLLIIVSYASALFLMTRISPAGMGRVLLIASLALIFFFEAAQRRADKERYGWQRLDVYRGDDRLFAFLSGRPERTVFVSSEEFQNRPLRWGVNTLNSYDPLILRDLSDMLDMEGIGYSHSWNELVEYNLILSMLNVKYLVVPYKEVPRVEGVKGKLEKGLFVPPIGPGLPPDKDYQPIYERLFGNGGQMLYLNRNFLPRAFTVTGLTGVKDVSEVIGKLYTFRVDPRRQAMLFKDDLNAIGQTEFSSGEVKIADYSATRVTLSTGFAGKGFVVLADQFYPGWKAYVDGKPTAIYKTNGVLRGVVVPAGEHELIFKYAPLRICFSMIISSAALLIAVIIILRKKTTDGKGIHFGNNPGL